jgi:hypothetical protein
MSRDAHYRRTIASLVAFAVGVSTIVTLVMDSPSDAAPAPPSVRCAWALADANVATPAFDYGPVDLPSATSEPACTYDPVSKRATQSANAPGALPIVRDSAVPRAVELWAAVSDPASDAFATGAGTVRWEVVGPGGGTPTVVQSTARSCAGTTEPGAMWRWASREATGSRALSPSAVTNADRRGLWEECRQGAVRVFFGRLDVATTADSCGVQTVTAIATVGARRAEKRYGVNVMCPVDVVLDATQISWVVAAGSASTVTGDLDPTTKNAPTLTNRGARPTQVGVMLTPMTRPSDASSVGQFSAVVRTASGAATTAERIAAGDRVWLTRDGFTLCPGESAQFSLTLHVGAQLANGTYTGRISILAREGGQC